MLTCSKDHILVLMQRSTIVLECLDIARHDCVFGVLLDEQDSMRKQPSQQKRFVFLNNSLDFQDKFGMEDAQNGSIVGLRGCGPSMSLYFFSMKRGELTVDSVGKQTDTGCLGLCSRSRQNN